MSAKVDRLLETACMSPPSKKVDAADNKLSVLPLTQQRVFRLTSFSLAAGICLQKLALRP